MVSRVILGAEELTAILTALQERTGGVMRVRVQNLSAAVIALEGYRDRRKRGIRARRLGLEEKVTRLRHRVPQNPELHDPSLLVLEQLMNQSVGLLRVVQLLE